MTTQPPHRPSLDRAVTRAVPPRNNQCLTTEAIVADKPEKESAPAMPGGDMDF